MSDKYVYLFFSASSITTSVKCLQSCKKLLKNCYACIFTSLYTIDTLI